MALSPFEVHDLMCHIELGRSTIITMTGDVQPAYTPDARQAFDQLVRENLGLVYDYVHKHPTYTYRGMEQDDLIQVGTIGLMHAIKKYDYRKGFAFSTYATWWIRQYVTRALMGQRRLIHVPIYIQTKRRELQRFLLAHPTIQDEQDIAQALEISVEVLHVVQSPPLDATSLDEHVRHHEDEDSTLVDMIADDSAEQPFEQVEDITVVEWLLSLLTRKQRMVIEMRYGLAGKKQSTLEEIAQIWKVTRASIQQIEERAIQRMQREKEHVML